jgi:hypothetical protein
MIVIAPIIAVALLSVALVSVTNKGGEAADPVSTQTGTATGTPTTGPEATTTATPTTTPSTTPTPPNGPVRVQMASMTVESFDASGCVRTVFNVFAQDGEIRPSVSESVMQIRYEIRDVCAGVWLEQSLWAVPLEPDDFDVSPNRRSARLNFGAPMPAPGGIHDVDIALLWTSDAKAVEQALNHINLAEIIGPTEPDRTRSAEISGTVTVDGVTIVPGGNLVSAPQIFWTVP